MFRKPNHNNLILLLALFAVVFLFPACNTNKYLQDGQTYIHKNNIILNAEERIKGKGNLKDDLATLYKQRPNKRFLKLTRSKLWFHYKTNSPKDTSRIDRIIRKFFAEKPQIYDEDLTAATAESMKYFLQNRGYHEAEVSHSVELRKKTSIVSYNVNLKNMYKFESIKYNVEDKNILALLNDSQKESYLKPGKNVDGQLYESEVTRISELLLNSGYAYFNRGYISSLEGDSTNFKVNASLTIDINDEVAKKVYSIKDIYVYPNYNPTTKASEIKDTTVNGIQFFHPGNDAYVRYSALQEAIYIKKGDLYREDDFDATIKRFTELGAYRFIDIDFEPDALEPNKLNVKIVLTPSKKYVIGYNVDLNNSNYSQQQANTLIGTGVSFNLRNRNLRRSAGLMINNIEIGSEINPLFAVEDSTRFFNTIDVKLESDFLIPRFVDPIRFWKGMNRINLISDNFYKTLKENATTRISASYNFLSLFRFRSHNLFNANFLGYSLKLRSGHQLTLNHFGVNYYSPRTEPAFDEILDNNTFLRNSFGKQFFTGVVLKDFTYTYSKPSDGIQPPFFFRASFEQSGAEVALLNWGVNGLDKPFQFEFQDNSELDTISFFHYITVDLEARRFYQIGQSQQFVMRGNIGIARPFAPSEEVPYVKQFFVGGPTSIRAWNIRELGPGSYEEPFDPDLISFFQTGDFKMEFNMEYRFPIYWYLEGAFFLDAGNIFTFDEGDRPGSQLDGNFINKMAVGGGYGIRFNVQYFILRLDMGMKLRLPFDDENNRHWQFYKWKDLQNVRDVIGITNFNLAIGYPF